MTLQYCLVISYYSCFQLGNHYVPSLFSGGAGAIQGQDPEAATQAVALSQVIASIMADPAPESLAVEQRSTPRGG